MKHEREIPETPNEEILANLLEGIRIAYDPNVRGYRDMDELKAALLDFDSDSDDDSDQIPSLLYKQSQEVTMPTYKIMTCNLRTDCDSDGINSFMNRRPFISEKLAAYSPDIIGFQEIRPHMYSWLVENLADYYVVGGGRGRDRGDEAVCIAFKKSEFFLCDLETFWLSATPDVPGSRYSGDQSVCPRICSVATLKPVGGEPFRVFNVHTDHVGKVARVLAANQLLQKLSELNQHSFMPCFITGDFNAEPDDLCIKTMTSYTGTPLVDLTAESGITFHNFGKMLEDGIKIDYIFANADINCHSMIICRDMKDGVFISDHYPIMVEVEF